jgi:hypothetical protein
MSRRGLELSVTRRIVLVLVAVAVIWFAIGLGSWLQDHGDAPYRAQAVWISTAISAFVGALQILMLFADVFFLVRGSDALSAQAEVEADWADRLRERGF